VTTVNRALYIGSGGIALCAANQG